MKTEQVNLRLEADLISALELAAGEEFMDRGTMIRKLLLGALAQRRVDRALQHYQLGEISIGRAAEDASLTHWEFLDLARRRGIACQLDVDAVADRLALGETPFQPRVAEGVESYRASDVGRARARRSNTARVSTASGPTLPDHAPRRGGVLIVGLNPAPPSVAAGHYYQGRLGRRLWRRLTQVGLLTDAVPGSEDEALIASGHGLTDLVKRVTRSARDLSRDELERGVQELRTKVLAWEPGLVLFVFNQAASLVLGSQMSSGPGAPLEGVPTFLLSGPYASRDETDRVNAGLRNLLSQVLADAPGIIMSQRLTEADLEAGIVRLPRAAKVLLPNEIADVLVVLRGMLLKAHFNPMRHSDRERSGVLRFGTKPLSRRVKPGDRLRVSKGPHGRVHLD